jgi:hypothetical protein
MATFGSKRRGNCHCSPSCDAGPWPTNEFAFTQYAWRDDTEHTLAAAHHGAWPLRNAAQVA